ncbi:MAG: hypothetical protein CL782_03250 [Chloroflexi bacterium]|nr:hypothetical protein [Chloroflexota bacterium]|tara:strand:+ start:34233 stop:35609 length:1377 start_codon:yes stop_codon:yes gene_type:complete
MSNNVLDKMLNYVDEIIPEIIKLEQDLVNIPSVNTGKMPTGNETAVCEYIKKWLNSHGIESQILEFTANRGNIIAQIKGINEKIGLIFMSHTDVVPVEDESKWKYPPFSATIDSGRIYGRGASDCKGLLTAQLMAMRILREFNITLTDGLSLISGADEEHGGKYGFKWLADNHPQLLEAPYAINEGGGTPMIESAGAVTYLLGVGEKGRLQVEISITGSSAHASMPWNGENALYKTSKILENLEQYSPERDTSVKIFDYLSNFAIEDKAGPENIDQIILDLEKDNPRFASTLKALSRMTITPTMINGGIKSNSVPEQIQLTCDVRTLPHQTEEYVYEELNKIVDGLEGVSYTVDYMAEPNSSEFETKLSSTILDATKKSLGRNDINLIPSISNGFTDSRFTRPLEVITYGFSGDHPDDDPMLSQIHGTNESIGINSLISSTKIMLYIAYMLLSGESKE